MAWREVSALPTSERQLPIDSGDGSPEADHLGAGQELLPDGAVIFPLPDSLGEVSGTRSQV
jgi:hypothetical protein